MSSGRCPGCASTMTTVVGRVAPTVAEGADTTSVTGCDVQVFGWSELGISERAAAAVMHPELILFVSTDGTTFEQIEAPTGFDVFCNGVAVGRCTSGVARYEFALPRHSGTVEVSLRPVGLTRYRSAGLQEQWFRMLAPVSRIELV